MAAGDTVDLVVSVAVREIVVAEVEFISGTNSKSYIIELDQGPEKIRHRNWTPNRCFSSPDAHCSHAV